MVLSLFKNKFWELFEITDKREIAFYDLDLFISFPGLKTSSAVFQTLGTCFSLKAALIRFVSLRILFLVGFLRTAPMKR